MQVDTARFSWFQVPENIKKLLILAASAWEKPAQAEKYMQQAIAQTGDNIDVLVAAYRYFYYSHNYPLALQTSRQVLERIKNLEAFPDDWEKLQPILVNRQAEPIIRLYLNAYTASGLVLAKLEQFDAAKEIATRVKQFDGRNEFGAAILLDILTRPPEEDE